MVIISDTTTISNLLLINKLWILEKLYSEIIIPQAVFNELMQLEKHHQLLLKEIKTSWITVKTVINEDLMIILSLSLDKGESEAIVLAKELKADLLIIDELKGRRFAKELKLNFIGLMGILLLAKEKGIIENVKTVLKELQEIAGFWISNNLRNIVLETANEK